MGVISSSDIVSPANNLKATFHFSALWGLLIDEADIRRVLESKGYSVLLVEIPVFSFGVNKFTVICHVPTQGTALVHGTAMSQAIAGEWYTVWDVAVEQYEIVATPSPSTGGGGVSPTTTISLVAVAIIATVGAILLFKSGVFSR